jgi:hypothetical protein
MVARSSSGEIMSAKTKLALLAASACVIACFALSAALAEPRTAGIKDADTREWWKIAETLSSDAMDGRDIGSPGHDRANQYVAERFKAAGLKPAGDNGTFFQSFPVHETRVDSAQVAVVRDGVETPLKFLHQYTVRAAEDLPGNLDAPLMFGGYCRPEDVAAAKGKAVICFDTRRAGLTTSAQRMAAVQAVGGLAVIQVADPYFTIEPARWPFAYARSVTIADAPPPRTGGLVAMSLNANALAALIEGSSQDAAALLKAGGTKAPLPVFDTPGRLKAGFKISSRDFSATNVLAVLPGSDPKLAAEHVVLSAHLDGYGHGEPVNGDGLYNGALDDAAYVGTLIRFADKLKGKPLKRSVVFASFTGEEKGLLGAKWFVRHPTVAKTSLVANINLDQLRPLFPLKLMTVMALDESSLGATVRQIASAQGIKVQGDPEPERRLLMRADSWEFIAAGVPATGFVFGYAPGTEAERRYREWYEVRYHRPQDDITQPIDFAAAGAFNRFFYALSETVANAPKRPTWNTGSAYAPKP